MNSYGTAHPPAELVDVYDKEKHRWVIGLVKEEDFDSNRLYIHILYRSTNEDRWISSKYVKSFGTKCFNGRNYDVLKGGDRIDLLRSGPRIVPGTVVSVDVGKNRIKANPFGSSWSSLTSIRPVNFEQKVNHPDHQFILEYFSQGNNEIAEEIVTYLSDNEEESLPETDGPTVEIYHDWNDENEYDSRFREEDEDEEKKRDDRRVLGERKRNTPSWVGRNHQGQIQDRVRGLREEDPRFRRYKEKLLLMGFKVYSMEGDGNCLFRTISHQVYGTPDHHALVRKFCLDYMESEKEYFQPFVVGETEEDFRSYLAYKRQDGVWGDDIEIQAMCELYDRPAQVFAYDRVSGAKQLRTFHEPTEARQRPPMRLSFYGGGHYDSIIGPGHTENLLDEVGYQEEVRIELSKARKDRITDEREFKNDDHIEEALRISRQQYDDLGSQDIEETLKQSLEQAQLEEIAHVNGAVKESIVEADEHLDGVQALAASDIAATEEDALRHALAASKQMSIEETRMEQAELERALKLSEEEGTLSKEDADIEEALRLSRSTLNADDLAMEEALRRSQQESALEAEEAELERAMRLSAEISRKEQATKNANDYYAIGYSDEASIEEENLRKAIEASMRDK